MSVIRIGTRPSTLAMRQAEMAISRIRENLPELEITVVPLASEADLRPAEPVRKLGDKGVFVTRIEHALIAGEIDVAVHSLKDLPVEAARGLRIAACLPRGDPRDVIVSRTGESLGRLGSGSRVGTTSERRVTQLRSIRPDLSYLEARGNVDTRLAKLRSGQYDAVVLAAAGLVRLGLESAITEYLDPACCTPAPGQGIIALEARENDPLSGHLSRVSDRGAETAATLERALASAVHATCQTPFGALTESEDGVIRLIGCLFREGSLVRAIAEAPVGQEERLPRQVADRLNP